MARKKLYCVLCGEKIRKNKDDAMEFKGTLEHEEGGYICDDCYYEKIDACGGCGQWEDKIEGEYSTVQDRERSTDVCWWCSPEYFVSEINICVNKRIDIDYLKQKLKYHFYYADIYIDIDEDIENYEEFSNLEFLFLPGRAVEKDYEIQEWFDENFKDFLCDSWMGEVKEDEEEDYDY